MRSRYMEDMNPPNLVRQYVFNFTQPYRRRGVAFPAIRQPAELYPNKTNQFQRFIPDAVPPPIVRRIGQIYSDIENQLQQPEHIIMIHE